MLWEIPFVKEMCFWIHLRDLVAEQTKNSTSGWTWESSSNLDSSGRFSKRFGARGSEIIGNAINSCFHETKEFDSELSCYIDFFVDEQNSTVFLQLVSFYDLSWLCTILDRDFSCLMDSEIHDWLESHDFHFCRALLLLFLCTDILICYNPSPCLDWAYLRIFRVMGMIKSSLERTFDINSSELIFKTPQIQFVFAVRNILSLHPVKSNEMDSQKSTGSFGNKGTNKAKKLQKSLEAQVKRLLKGCEFTDAKASALTSLFNCDLPQLCHLYTVYDGLSSEKLSMACGSRNPVRGLLERFIFPFKKG